MKLVTLQNSNLHKLEEFLESAGSALHTFRYFNSRPLNIINNHLVTYLIVNDKNKPVCYGHLDKDNDDIWLGISTTEACKGMGYGKLMMNYLINFAKNKELKNIRLSVDRDNSNAIKLYEKTGFIFEKENNKINYYRISL